MPGGLLTSCTGRSLDWRHGYRSGIAALDVLERNPLIGRPVGNGKRELVIGRRSHGYVALYRHVPEVDAAFALALRSRREAGYSERGD